MTDDPLWRVWRDGHWKLVRAKDSDCVYRSFPKKQREKITRVTRVYKTSEMMGGVVK